MKEQSGKNLIPDQNKGSKHDTSYEVKLSDEEAAKEVFAEAVKRLFDVNSWDKICGAMSAVFKLTDEEGTVVRKAPRPGDHFRIDIPGPGPASGNGYDWVRVEAMDDRRNSNASTESVTIRVRPSPTPENSDPDIAHFFSEDATSSFRVIRDGNIVRAEVHGRNEVPNTKSNSITDKVRNAVVGTSATAGMSAPQWKNLVKGLLTGK